MEENDQNQIQHNIHRTGDCQKDKRTARIADGTQNRRTKVVYHRCRHAAEVNLHIKRRLTDDIGRRIHPAKEGPRAGKAYDTDTDTADDRQQHRGMHNLMHAAFVFGAEKPCRGNIGTDRKPDEQIDDQIDERACGADSGKRRASGKPSDDNDIGGVIEQLQDAGQHQRYGKEHELWQQRPLTHIDFVLFCHYTLFL